MSLSLRLGGNIGDLLGIEIVLSVLRPRILHRLLELLLLLLELLVHRAELSEHKGRRVLGGVGGQDP